MSSELEDAAFEPLSVTDVTGGLLHLAEVPARIVSLVPSVTETLFALDAGALLVGRTRYCVLPDPQVRQIERVGGTKDPDLAKIAALKPDLILANREENRKADIEELRSKGLNVYVSEPDSVEQALAMVSVLGRLLNREQAADAIVRRGAQAITALQRRLDELQKQNQLKLRPRRSARPRVLVFIWKDPWMVVGSRTYIGDMIQTLGGEHLLKNSAERYFSISGPDVAKLAPDIMLFPDEPFAFAETDLVSWRDNFRQIPAVRENNMRLCSGQDLAWSGSRTPDALVRLQSTLAW